MMQGAPSSGWRSPGAGPPIARRHPGCSTAVPRPRKSNRSGVRVPNPVKIAPTMPSYRYLHLDVFTDVPFAGNQLAVFPEPAGLAADAMQQIAREMNLSESTF